MMENHRNTEAVCCHFAKCRVLSWFCWFHTNNSILSQYKLHKYYSFQITVMSATKISCVFLSCSLSFSVISLSEVITLFTHFNSCSKLCFIIWNVNISPGSVTNTDTEYRGISKYRYRYQSRYSKYRNISNTEQKIPKKTIYRYFNSVNTTPRDQLSQIESFLRSVYSVILHKIVMTIQYSLS